MRAFWRVTLPLLLALGVLAWGAAAAVNQATQAWFMKDVTLRARVVAIGAQGRLASHISSGEPGSSRRFSTTSRETS